MVEVAIFNVQRAITPQGCNLVLWFMRSACHHILLTICVKLHYSDGFQVTEWTQFCGRNGNISMIKG